MEGVFRRPAGRARAPEQGAQSLAERLSDGVEPGLICDFQIRLDHGNLPSRLERVADGRCLLLSCEARCARSGMLIQTETRTTVGIQQEARRALTLAARRA
jgi:hypothetical protein